LRMMLAGRGITRHTHHTHRTHRCQQLAAIVGGNPSGVRLKHNRLEDFAREERPEYDEDSFDPLNGIEDERYGPDPYEVTGIEKAGNESLASLIVAENFSAQDRVEG